MPRYAYAPDCPLANENGMVIKDELYYSWLALKTDDKRMMNGNQPVEFRFISDTMEPTRHMCNSKYYTSKSKFRQITKQHGCVEIGNEVNYVMKNAQRKPSKDYIRKTKIKRREDIKRAVWEIQNGRDIKTEVRNVIDQDRRTTV